jgi:hypothetical protein
MSSRTATASPSLSTSELSPPIRGASTEAGNGSGQAAGAGSSASIVSLRVSSTENRIWLDVEAGIYAIVSDEDYAWALQWSWQITWDRHKRKAYATRSASTHGGRRVKYYLHKEVLKRSGKVQPSEKHHMGDHGDGSSLN